MTLPAKPENAPAPKCGELCDPRSGAAGSGTAETGDASAIDLQSSGAASSRDRRVVSSALFAIIILGCALRFAGIGWGLPNAFHPGSTYHPDELINLGAALRVDIPHGKLDTQFYSYGAFYFLLTSLANTVLQGWGLVRPDRLQSVHYLDALFLTGRVITAIMGTLTIPVVWSTGKRLYGVRTGLIAALLFAIAPLAVIHSHFYTVDVPSTLFVALAILWSARLLESAEWKEYIAAGIWCGLAAATKYTAGAVIAAPLTAHFVGRIYAKPNRVLQPLGLAAAAAIAFLIGCPGPWLNWDVFWNGAYPGSGLRYELFVHSRAGHGLLFVNTGPGWWYHFAISLPFGLGISLFLLCLAAVVFAGRRRTPQDILLLTFVLFYFMLTSLSAVRFARYMIPLFPALCILAARLLAVQNTRRSVQAAAAIAGILVVVSTLACSARLVGSMISVDPRDAAAAFLSRTAPRGASVAFATTPWFYSPPLSPSFGAVRPDLRRAAAVQTTRYSLRIPTGEWRTSVLHPPPDYIAISNMETMHPLRLHQAAAIEFLSAIPADYIRKGFGASWPIPDLPQGTIIPEDILYILPQVNLYIRPGLPTR
ncbi:MAG TPA: glycosyltransferase family 39 protein [Chthonomonadales bacterium]|nr:glycosyltransferase family 39 protein [Chthonomonadales bacterium]